ncbi:cysteine proteinase [Basidiobolus meristosporus CBS 931.73]|uniref:Cysteine proteinase n=1 Tax=Basidiobolus meristosporus CBS 931.73 TaxID=1314790 RepID=A0A1Y1YQM4_9FUNG|nr:cysteine proteinase [Basidiobolus meristosporus CBS 931.73]|eukprot:ORY00047.1 cysteine proteinase [Basidiobolus meristosporus CBS 931.73]
MPVSEISSFSLQEYFNRIGFESDGNPPPTLETLQKLHYLHRQSIPFENLALHYGPEKGISIEPEKIFHKLVTKRRGGYCFEQNSLFSRVLKELGYTLYTGMASVAEELEGELRYLGRSHMLIFVKYDEQLYLADVGFGSPGTGAILPIQEDLSFSAIGNQEYRFRRICHPEGARLDLCPTGLLLEHRYTQPEVSPWKPMYFLTFTEFTHLDYELANYYTSTNPKTIFLRHKIVGIPTLDGRVTLLDKELRIRKHNGEVTRITLKDEDEVKSALNEHFGIVLDEE